MEQIDPEYKKYPGVIITGTHQPLDWERKLEMIQLAREHNVPFLGICMGMQLMLVEYAKNVINMVDANSEEIDKDCLHPVVIKMDHLRVGIKPVQMKNPVTGEEYESMESHWHNYKFNDKYTEIYEHNGMEFIFTDDGGVSVAEVAILKGRPSFIGVQFHPEYQSSKKKPHPLLVEFLNVCRQSQ